MREIKVGEYVRTKDGFIGKKVKDGLRKGTIEIEDNMCSWITDIRIITKHSFDLIDLIEIGDYVNGDKIVAIDYTEDENGNYKDVLGIMEIDDDYAYSIELSRIHIKSVVTKEAFASVEYKVGGENERN